MPKLTKRQFEEMFREEVMPYLVEREREGFPDKPARREAWNNTIDSYIRDRTLPEAAGNWAHPRWLETWKPARSHHATTARTKSPAQLDREIAEALAAKSGLSKHQRYLLSQRGPGGGLRAGHLTPAGWHGDPMAIEDRKLRLEALREQPAPRFPKAHATKRGASKGEGFKIGDAVQFRWEPGTGGVIRRFEPDGSAGVATPRGERTIPVDALVLVRKEHEERVRRAVHTAGHARVRKTKDIWVVQGNYGYGHGWEDVTAAETWKEAKENIREYRENERGVPFRVIRRREPIAA